MFACSRALDFQSEGKLYSTDISLPLCCPCFLTWLWVKTFWYWTGTRGYPVQYPVQYPIEQKGPHRSIPPVQYPCSIPLFNKYTASILGTFCTAPCTAPWPDFATAVWTAPCTAPCSKVRHRRPHLWEVRTPIYSLPAIWGKTCTCQMLRKWIRSDWKVGKHTTAIWLGESPLSPLLVPHALDMNWPADKDLHGYWARFDKYSKGVEEQHKQKTSPACNLDILW